MTRDYLSAKVWNDYKCHLKTTMGTVLESFNIRDYKIFCGTQLRPSLPTSFAKCLALALDGLDLFTDHKLSSREKISTEPGFKPEAGG